MYLEFYGLRAEPFGVTPDPDYLYLGSSHREAQEMLERALRSSGLTVLVAEPGLGKTTLLFRLLEEHASTSRTAFLFHAPYGPRQFMVNLLTELGLDVGNENLASLRQQFQNFLDQRAEGERVILVIDEAQHLAPEVLGSVSWLSDLGSTHPMLHIILAGQPEFGAMLATPTFCELRERVSHWVVLHPLCSQEVSRYIDHRLRTAGYSGLSLFTPQAGQLIFEVSRGIPRLINNLCFNALSLGYALGKQSIDAAILGEVSAELELLPLAATAHRDNPPLDLPRPCPEVREELEEAASFELRKPAPPALACESVRAEARPAPLVELPLLQALQPAQPACVPAPSLIGERVAAVPKSMASPGLEPSHAGRTDTESHVCPSLADEATASTDFQPRRATPPPGSVSAGAASTNTALEPERDEVRHPVLVPAGASDQAGSMPAVDLDVLVQDYALFGMEDPRRKRPVGVRPGSVSLAAATAHSPDVTSITAPALPAAPQTGCGEKAPHLVAKQQPPARKPAAAAPPPEGMHRKATPLYVHFIFAALLLGLIIAWILVRMTGAGSEYTSSPITAPAPTVLEVSRAIPLTGSAEDDSSRVSSAAAAPGPPPTSELDLIEETPNHASRSADRVQARLSTSRAPGEQLVQVVDPVYPAAARINGIQGKVVLNAKIGRDGYLRHIQVVSGNPLLADATLEAVKGWRYRQRTRAAENSTEIVVNFRLQANPRLVGTVEADR